MKTISDMQIGKAGEYLVCVDLILNGYIAYPSEQGLPYDLILDDKGKLYKIQVKTTRKYSYLPQRKDDIPAYLFKIGINGKKQNNKIYKANQVDIFAIVALDSKEIAYIPYSKQRTSMSIRVTKFRGQYHNEQGSKIKQKVIKLRESGLACETIADKLSMKLSTVYKYSANVDISQKRKIGYYFDDFKLEDCLQNINNNQSEK